MSPKLVRARSNRPPSRLTRIKLRPDGTLQVGLPEGSMPWRLGQRVWFQAWPGRVKVSPKPHGRRGNRRNSSRIRRGFKSLLKRS